MTLKELVLANPKLPVAILISDKGEDYGALFYVNPDASLVEVLEYDGKTYFSREDFKEDVSDEIFTKYSNKWQKCIIVDM